MNKSSNGRRRQSAQHIKHNEQCLSETFGKICFLFLLCTTLIVHHLIQTDYQSGQLEDLYLQIPPQIRICVEKGFYVLQRINFFIVAKVKAFSNIFQSWLYTRRGGEYRTLENNVFLENDMIKSEISDYNLDLSKHVTHSMHENIRPLPTSDENNGGESIEKVESIKKTININSAASKSSQTSLEFSTKDNSHVLDESEVVFSRTETVSLNSKNIDSLTQEIGANSTKMVDTPSNSVSAAVNLGSSILEISKLVVDFQSSTETFDNLSSETVFSSSDIFDNSEVMTANRRLSTLSTPKNDATTMAQINDNLSKQLDNLSSEIVFSSTDIFDKSEVLTANRLSTPSIPKNDDATTMSEINDHLSTQVDSLSSEIVFSSTDIFDNSEVLTTNRRLYTPSTLKNDYATTMTQINNNLSTYGVFSNTEFVSSSEKPSDYLINDVFSAKISINSSTKNIDVNSDITENSVVNTFITQGSDGSSTKIVDFMNAKSVNILVTDIVDTFSTKIQSSIVETSVTNGFEMLNTKMSFTSSKNIVDLINLEIVDTSVTNIVDEKLSVSMSTENENINDEKIVDTRRADKSLFKVESSRDEIVSPVSSYGNSFVLESTTGMESVAISLNTSETELSSKFSGDMINTKLLKDSLQLNDLSLVPSSVIERNDTAPGDILSASVGITDLDSSSSAAHIKHKMSLNIFNGKETSQFSSHTKSVVKIFELYSGQTLNKDLRFLSDRDTSTPIDHEDTSLNEALSKTDNFQTKQEEREESLQDENIKDGSINSDLEVKTSVLEKHNEPGSGKIFKQVLDTEDKLLSENQKQDKTEFPDCSHFVDNSEKIQTFISFYDSQLALLAASSSDDQSLLSFLLYGRAKCLDRLSELKKSNKLLEATIEAYMKVISLNFPSSFRPAAERIVYLADFRGWNGKVIEVLYLLSLRFPADVSYKNQIGKQFLLLGQYKEAINMFRGVLSDKPDNIVALVYLGFILKTHNQDLEQSVDLMRRGLSGDPPEVRDGRFYLHLGDALRRIGHITASNEIYERGVGLGLFASFWQRSFYNVEGLTARPIWNASQTGWSNQLEIIRKNWRTIRYEARLILLDSTMQPGFVEENEQLLDTGRWRQFEMYRRGRKIKSACLRAPVTCKLIDAFPSAKDNKRGQVKFSVIYPGTHIYAHSGPTNCRLRLHLGLDVPTVSGEDSRLRVANHMLKWSEGEFFIFDDSFDHEVWHNGGMERIILIMDMWHPDLTQEQIDSLFPL